MNTHDQQYFNAQGLYAFDCIVIMFDVRFTATDVVILENCERYNIPSFIVHSKSNQHIENLVCDMDNTHSNEEDDVDDEISSRCTDSEPLLSKARDLFVGQTRENVKYNLAKTGLPQRRVYVVSKDTILAMVKNCRLTNGILVIDEPA